MRDFGLRLLHKTRRLNAKLTPVSFRGSRTCQVCAIVNMKSK